MKKKSKIDTKNVILPHSKAKIEFFKAYLDRYLPILINSSFINEITIVDAFCGQGEYSDGGLGSPIETYYAIKNIVASSLYKNNPTKINHIINDIKKSNTDKVEEYINQQGGINNWIFESYNLEFDGFKNYLFNSLENQAKTARTLIFLDPYGYKDIDIATLSTLLENQKTEVLLWLPIANIKRFINKSMESSEPAFMPLKNFLMAFFPNNLDELDSKMNVFELINKITKAIRVNDNFYSTSYYIERDQTNYYSMFFITPNNLGFEKILEVKWKLDEISGRGYVQAKQPTLFDVEFNSEDKTKTQEYLKNELRNFLNTAKNNLEIREFILSKEFLPKHLVVVLKQWITLKAIEIIDMQGNKLETLNQDHFGYKNFKNKIRLFSVKYIK